jgi:hypothetical protein
VWSNDHPLLCCAICALHLLRTKTLIEWWLDDVLRDALELLEEAVHLPYPDLHLIAKEPLPAHTVKLASLNYDARDPKSPLKNSFIAAHLRASSYAGTDVLAVCEIRDKGHATALQEVLAGEWVMLPTSPFSVSIKADASHSIKSTEWMVSYIKKDVYELVDAEVHSVSGRYQAYHLRHKRSDCTFWLIQHHGFWCCSGKQRKQKNRLVAEFCAVHPNDTVIVAADFNMVPQAVHAQLPG